MFAPVVLVRVGASAVPVRVITHDLETMRHLLQGNAMIHDAHNDIQIKLHTDRIHARAQRQDTCEGTDTAIGRDSTWDTDYGDGDEDAHSEEVRGVAGTGACRH